MWSMDPPKAVPAQVKPRQYRRRGCERIEGTEYVRDIVRMDRAITTHGSARFRLSLEHLHGPPRISEEIGCYQSIRSASDYDCVGHRHASRRRGPAAGGTSLESFTSVSGVANRPIDTAQALFPMPA